MDTGDLLGKDKVLTEKQFVLLAFGPLAQSQSQVTMLKHVTHAASACACEVTSCDKACSCPVGFFYQMLKLHGE